jgi:hypothetical protein
LFVYIALHRALHLPKLDQQQMIDIRAAWFDGNYGPPPGNKLPHERDQWQLAPEGHAISERGKMQAAVELSKQLQQRIKQRGCREEFVANADVLEQGKVEFLPAAALSAEELERQRLAAEAAAKATRSVGCIFWCSFWCSLCSLCSLYIWFCCCCAPPRGMPPRQGRCAADAANSQLLCVFLSQFSARSPPPPCLTCSRSIPHPL